MLVQTPAMNYTVRDYPAFFRDIGFPRGLTMMEGVRGLVSLAHPGVTTVCVASRGVTTPSKLVYSQVGTMILDKCDGKLNRSTHSLMPSLRGLWGTEMELSHLAVFR